MTRGVGGESPANIQTYLKGVDYPSDKQALLKQAQQNGAPDEVIRTIDSFEDQEYGGPQDVMKAYGQTH
ncbi:DUF2795 domain-containing protein [Lysobacter sp. D1-1-M9]|uniref:DUF2795 domain-containing protein n=1 Tax=Novilysobacter longmucuonensis TaxID=3098603 RepID=UPI002FCBDD9F